MDPATPDISSLDERDDHNLRYCTQYAEAEGTPFRAAHGLNAYMAAVEVMKNTNGIDMPAEIYPKLEPETAQLLYPGLATNANDLSGFRRSVLSQEGQKVLPWDVLKHIPHWCCTECGKMAERCSTVTRHADKNHFKGQEKSFIELRNLVVDVFLPLHVANNRVDWLRRLGSLRGPLPSMLGKRDIFPILDPLKTRIDSIIANKQQVIPSAHEILGPAPPPASVMGPSSSAALVEDTPSLPIPGPPSPPVASTSRKNRKRKAAEEHVGDEDCGVAKPKRARRGNTTPVADADTVAAAPTTSSASASQPVHYDIPIDPVLLSSDANNVAAAPAPFPTADSSFGPVPDWLRDLMPPQPAADPFADMAGSGNEAQASEKAYVIVPASVYYAGGADIIGAPAPQPSSRNWSEIPPDFGLKHMAFETSHVSAAAYDVPVTASSSSRGRSSSLFSEGQSGYSSSTAVNVRNLNAVDLAKVVNAQNSVGEAPYPGSDDDSPAGPYVPGWLQNEPDGLWDDIKFSRASSPAK